MTFKPRITSLLPQPRLTALAVASVLTLSAPWAHADDRAELEQLRATNIALMQALIDAGLLTREKADDILKQARKTVAAPEAASAKETKDAKDPIEAKDAVKDEAAKPKVIRVPFVPEAVKAEMREQIKQEVLVQAHNERWGDPGSMPGWLRSISVEGDLRVRYQHDLFDRNNMAPNDVQGGFAAQTGSPIGWSPDLINTQNDRDRLTLRARLGIKSDLGEGFTAGMRLSTGSGNSPVGASQTQGNYFNKYSSYFDQAYLRYDHEGNASAIAGRFANPFYGTDLTWPDDLNFDGVAASIKPAFGAGQSAFLTVGAFPLQELETTRADKWLTGAQVGVAWVLAPAVQFKAGLAMYNFRSIEGVSDTREKPGGASANVVPYLTTEYPAGVRQKGNTLIRINNGSDATSNATVWGLASRFTPVDLSMDVTFLQFFPISVKVSFDYIKNTGFDLQDIYARFAGSEVATASYPIANKTSAMQAKLSVGVDRIERAGQWQSFLSFRRMERDAWVDAFTDTTWNLGGTSYQGWSIGGQYGVGHRTSIGARWTSTRSLTDSTQIGGTPVLTNATLKIDVLQLELNTRF